MINTDKKKKIWRVRLISFWCRLIQFNDIVSQGSSLLDITSIDINTTIEFENIDFYEIGIIFFLI